MRKVGMIKSGEFCGVKYQRTFLFLNNKARHELKENNPHLMCCKTMVEVQFLRMNEWTGQLG